MNSTNLLLALILVTWGTRGFSKDGLHSMSDAAAASRAQTEKTVEQKYIETLEKLNACSEKQQGTFRRFTIMAKTAAFASIYECPEKLMAQCPKGKIEIVDTATCMGTCEIMDIKPNSVILPTR